MNIYNGYLVNYTFWYARLNFLIIDLKKKSSVDCFLMVAILVRGPVAIKPWWPEVPCGRQTSRLQQPVNSWKRAWTRIPGSRRSSLSTQVPGVHYTLSDAYTKTGVKWNQAVVTSMLASSLSWMSSKRIYASQSVRQRTFSQINIILKQQNIHLRNS